MYDDNLWEYQYVYVLDYIVIIVCMTYNDDNPISML